MGELRRPVCVILSHRPVTLVKQKQHGSRCVTKGEFVAGVLLL